MMIDELLGLEYPLSEMEEIKRISGEINRRNREPGGKNEAGVYKGVHIQNALAAYLKRYTPYVLTEASSARYDLIAYVSEEAWFGKPPKQREELGCTERFKRTYCYLKQNALFREIEIRHEEDGRIARNEAGRIIHDLWGRETNELEVWEEFKDSCKCDNDPNCPRYRNQFSYNKKGRCKVDIGPGLHLFEVKSEKDTLDRLRYQIPEMMHLADYVWLVLASNHEIPDWVPPFIGIIHHDGKEFILERQPDGVRKKPSYYWQALEYYNISESEAKQLAIVGRRVHELYRAWFINSVFHFAGWQEVAHQVVVDMTRSRYWLNQFKGVLIESKALKEAKDQTQARIFDFFDQLSHSPMEGDEGGKV